LVYNISLLSGAKKHHINVMLFTADASFGNQDYKVLKTKINIKTLRKGLFIVPHF